MKVRTHLDYRNEINAIMGLPPVVKDNNLSKDAEIAKLQKQLKKEKSNNGNLRDRLTHNINNKSKDKQEP